MGQSVNLDTPKAELSVFLTDLGWFGLTGVGDKLISLTFGHLSRDEVRAAVRDVSSAKHVSERYAEVDWCHGLRARLQRYCRGEHVEFDDVELQLPQLTAFQESVLAAARSIRYGQTISYGQLAELAGYHRSARAVGTVMASNRFPILIPCHRVLRSAGKLGGYSAPQGVSLKERLLAMEAETAKRCVLGD